MNDLERRLRKLEADVEKAKRQSEAIERAKDISEVIPRTIEVQKTLYEVRCGNCEALFGVSETALLQYGFTQWRFCPMCGVRIKGGYVNDRTGI